VEIGVGVHVGTVVMGHIGSKHRISYTVIGDAVNVAARLESATKEHGCPVLISEEVARSPEQDLPVEEVGELGLKGRSAKVKAYTVRQVTAAG
jgi:adenylate cyclase